MTSYRRPVALALGAALLFGLSTPAAKILVAGVDPWMLAGLLYLGSGLGLGLLLGVRRAAARFVFREHFDARIAVGMALITLGALALAWQGTDRLALDRGAILVAAACLAWALDNNVTRRVSAADPVVIAALKGTAAGTANIVIAVATGAPLPGSALALGAGRTAAYFSIAPFIGAVAAVILLDETVTAQLGLAGVLMGLGVWLHLSERHEHEHLHEPVEHDHLHAHDEHHQHEHAPGVSPGEPHSHPHAHHGLRHSHPHYPDLHHRHEHR
jgi:drug/metabolite transporter (DMT)-like permease